jgi:hypothetical protein
MISPLSRATGRAPLSLLEETNDATSCYHQRLHWHRTCNDNQVFLKHQRQALPRCSDGCTSGGGCWSVLSVICGGILRDRSSPRTRGMPTPTQDLRFLLHTLAVRTAELLFLGWNAITGWVSAFLWI